MDISTLAIKLFNIEFDVLEKQKEKQGISLTPIPFSYLSEKEQEVYLVQAKAVIELFAKEELKVGISIQSRDNHYVAIRESTNQPVYVLMRNHTGKEDVQVQIQHEDFTMCQRILRAYLNGATNPFSWAVATTLPSELPLKERSDFGTHLLKNCLHCKHWQRTPDTLKGYCQNKGSYRYQDHTHTDSNCNHYEHNTL